MLGGEIKHTYMLYCIWGQNHITRAVYNISSNVLLLGYPKKSSARSTNLECYVFCSCLSTASVDNLSARKLLIYSSCCCCCTSARGNIIKSKEIGKGEGNRQYTIYGSIRQYNIINKYIEIYSDILKICI